MSEFYTSVHYFFQNPTQHIAQLLGTIKPAIAKLVHIAIAKLVHISWKPHLHS